MNENVVDAYPLTPLQRGMFFEALAEPESDVNTAYITFDIAGSVDLEKLNIAWNKTISRYATLRTVFLWEGLEQPLQAVLGECALSIDVETLVASSTKEKNNLLEDVIDQLRKKPFRMNRAPLMSLRLIKWGESDYTMIWAVHHLLADAWSAPLIIQSVLERYGSREHQISGGVEFNFSEFIAHQVSLDDDAISQHWERYLADAQSTRFKFTKTALIEFSGGDDGNSRKDACSCRLDPELELALNQFCAASSITLGTFFHAIWAVVVAAYSDTTRPVFGTLFSGRYQSLPGINDAVGAFINILPVCVSLNEDRSLADWMLALQSDLQENQSYESVDLLKIRRFFSDSDAASVFDSVIVIEPESAYAQLVSEDNSLALKNFSYQVDSTVPLTVMIFKSDVLNFRFEFDPGRFDETQVTQMQTDFLNLIGSVTKSPEQSALGLLNDLLDGYNTSGNFRALESLTVGDVPNVSEWFSRTASLEKGNKALIHAAGETSYAGLQRNVDLLVSHLAEFNVKPSEIVAICITGIADQIISMLGVLQAGCTYLVLDPESSSDRLKTILDRSNCQVAIVDEKAGIKFNTLSVRTADYAQLRSEKTKVQSEQKTAVTRNHHLATDDLAYVLFTSGSTGQPKGVKVTHANLVYSTLARLEYYQVHNPCFMMVSPTTFDSSVAGIYWALLGGGKLVLPERDEVRDVQRIASLIAQHGVDTILCLPTFYKLLLEGSPSTQLTSLKRVILAGESCSPEIVEFHFSRLPDTALYNEYGPTECAVWASVAKLESGLSTVSIGKPIPGSVISIINSIGHPVPTGVCGEITISGPGVSLGYLNDDDATANQFIVEGAGEHSRTHYRTGDLGSWNAGGQLLFHGRLDRQVKIRGHRIELEEVESVIRENSKVSDVVVIGKRNPESELITDSNTVTRLEAYLAFHGKESALPSASVNHDSTIEANCHEIFDRLEERLPSYMHPSDLIVIEKIPRSRHGKTDMRGLSCAVELARHGKTHNLVDIQADVPDKNSKFDQKLFDELTMIAKDLLGVSEVFPDDKFYELGGDSITAIMFVSRAREIGFDCNIKQITDQKSFGAMASELSVTSVVEKNQGIDQKLFDHFIAPAKDLLNVSEIYPEDTFYNLGGDSITAIMFVSRARSNGFDCNIKHITDQKSFAVILNELSNDRTGSEAESGMVAAIGATPLTPIQKWFFSLEHPNPGKWNIAYQAKFSRTIELQLLEKAIVSVVQKYPSLGTKFKSSVDGWCSEIPGELLDGKIAQVTAGELALKGASYHEGLLSNIADTWSMEEGALYGFLIVLDDAGNATELDIIAHHLILDHFSVDLLIRNIVDGTGSLSKQATRDPVKSISLRQYAKTVDAEFRNGGGTGGGSAIMLPEWAAYKERSKAVHLPSTTEGGCRRIETRLDASATEKLLQATVKWNVNLLEVVTAATLYAWTQVCGNEQIDTYIETSGRNAEHSLLNVTNLMAWVTVFFPLNLQINAQSSDEILKNVRNELRLHPEKQALFLAWYYQHNTLPPTACSSNKSLLVNYLGDINQKKIDDRYYLSAFQGPFLRSDAAIRAFDLEINAYRENGELCVKWHIASTIKSALAEQLTNATAVELRKMEASVGEGNLYTPSDFTALSISRDDLDKLIDDIG